MAAAPSVHRISKEDLKDAPSWIDRLLSPLNSFMESVYSALNGKLTFGTNIQGQFKVINLVAGAAATNNTFTFTHTLGSNAKINGVVVVHATEVSTQAYTPVSSAVFVSWRQSGQQIVIDAITGLTNTKQYNVTVLVF